MGTIVSKGRNKLVPKLQTQRMGHRKRRSMQDGQHQTSWSRNCFMAWGPVKYQAIRILLSTTVRTGAPYLVVLSLRLFMDCIYYFPFPGMIINLTWLHCRSLFCIVCIQPAYLEDNWCFSVNISWSGKHMVLHHATYFCFSLDSCRRCSLASWCKKWL